MKTIAELIELEKQAPGELKPCPLCGCSAHHEPETRVCVQWTGCSSCRLQINGPGSVEQWNRRAPNDALPHLLAIAAHEDITTRGHRWLTPPCTCPACQARAAGLFGEVGE